MKYAICNELYGDWEHDRACAHAAQLGYTGLEVAPFTLGANPLEVGHRDLNEFRSTVESCGMEVVGLHWLLAKTEGFHLTTEDAAVRKATAQYLADLARLCRDLGGDIMVLGSPQQRNLADTQTMEQGTVNAVDVLQQLAPTLEQCGVTLALEPLGPQEGNFLLTADQGVELAKQVDSPNVRLHLDVKAMSSEPIPIDHNIRQHAQWMAHFHANDPNLRGPGMGDVDFEPIFRALHDVDYQGWVSVEVFDYEPGVDALAGDSIKYMKSMEQRVGD